MEKDFERAADGLLIVHTGNGKGKSTAAFGMALRCVAHGRPVGVVQFIKSRRDVAEKRALETFGSLVRFEVMGEGFSWTTRDPERDRRAAEKAWETARAMIDSGAFHLIILDEINIALHRGQIEPAWVVDCLRHRPAGIHVVATGRNAPELLVDAADLVTDMTEIKHPFHRGIKAQAGIEF